MKTAFKRFSALFLCCVMAFSAAFFPSALAAPARQNSPQPVTGKSAETSVYEFLKNSMGLNEAACCGVLANIAAESGFNYNSYGDYADGAPTSYGLCQWHYGRWDRLKNFCAENNYSVESLNGQLCYLQYELVNYYSSTLSFLKSVSNTADGAYDAGYYWCYYFENPSNRDTKAVSRGSTAATEYWSVYQYINEAASKVTYTEADAAGYYRVTASSGAVVRTYPADNDENKDGSAAFDSVVYADTLCTNSEGGQYYHVSSGTWADHFISAQVLENAGSVEDPLTASGVNYPEKLIVGTAFTIEGSFTSKISGIRSASVTILDSEGKSTGIGKSVTMNRMEYSLMSLDSYVKFGKLTVPGIYTYRVEVKNASETYLLEKQFEVLPVLAVNVSFDANGGSCGTQSLTLSAGSEYGTLPDPSRTDCYFVGWYTQKTGGSRVTSSSKIDTEKDHTLYAHWSIPAPTDLTAKSNLDGTVSLSWNSTPNAESWVVYYRLAGYSAWNEYKTVTEKKCTVSGLSNASKYEFSVKSAWTSGGKQELSSERSSVSSAVSLSPPGTPGGLSAVHSRDGVKISWKSVGSASSYTLRYSSDGENWAEKTGLESTTCTLTQLDDTLTYTFRLCAVSSFGGERRTGSWSDTVTMSAKAIASSPGLLDAISGDNGTVTLSWSDTGADGYQIYYREKGAPKWISGPDSGGPGMDVTGLKDRTNYEFYVEAYTLINGTKTPASGVSPTVECAVFKAPDAPAAVNAVRNDDGSITVTWQSVEGSSGYTLSYCSSGGSWSSENGITTTSFTLKNVKEAKSYSIRICALGSFAGTTKAGAFSDTVTAPAKKAAPAPGSIKTVSDADGSVLVSWSRVSGADGYRVYYRNIIHTDGRADDYGEWMACSTTTSDSYRVTGLKNLVNYQFRVASYTLVDGSKSFSDGYSDRSSAPSVMKPDVPSGLVAELTASGGIHVMWGAVEGASGYVLSYSADGGVWENTDETRSPEAVLQGIGNSAEYRFRVRAACTAYGVSRYSDNSAVLTSGTAASGKILLLPPESVSAVSNGDGSVTVTWTASDGADGYRVYWGRLIGESTDVYGTLNVYETANTRAVITGLEDMAGYVFCVRSCADSDGIVLVSDTASAFDAAPSVIQPNIPTGLAVTRSEDNEARIRWNEVRSAGYYELQHSSDGVNWTTVTELTDCSYAVKGVDQDTRCYVRVRAVREFMDVKSFGQYSSIFTLLAAGDPTAEVTAVSGNDGSIFLSWDESTAADGYRVYYRQILNPDGDSPANPLWEMSEFITDTKLTLSSLEVMSGYEIKICAYIDVNGVKTLIDDYSAFTRAPSMLPPDMPENVSAAWTDSGALLVSWDAVNGADKYHLLYSTDGVTWLKVVVLEDTLTEISAVPSGSRCIVRVCACRSLMGVTKLSSCCETVAELNK